MRRVGSEITPRRTAATIAGLLLLASACTAPHGAAVKDVDSESWETPAVIPVSNGDTTTLRDIGLFLRCNDSFTDDTLTVSIVVLTPDSLRHEEPFKMVIAPNHTPAALSREADIPYRHRVQLLRTGNYRIVVTPARPVRGVEAVGVNITESESFRQ